MAKGKPLAGMADLGRPFYRLLGNLAVKRLKELTRSGEGVDGRFPAYTSPYAKRKAAGAFKRQASTSSSPDLTLTGEFLKDLQVIQVDRHSVTIGWPSQGEKVEWNANAERAVSTRDDPMAKVILDALDATLRNEIEAASRAAKSDNRYNIPG